MATQKRIFTALIAVAVAAIPLGALAQTAGSDVPPDTAGPSVPPSTAGSEVPPGTAGPSVPPGGAGPSAPSYAAPAPSYGPQDEVIQGRISSFDGAYSLQVHDDRGFIDNVQLRQGTIINPTGLRLSPGMAVTIHGVNHGSVFAANQIDTPYQSYGPAYSYYPYGPYAYGPYAYPVYGYGYPYPAFSLGIGFNFGFGGYYHGGYVHGGYHH